MTNKKLNTNLETITALMYETGLQRHKQKQLCVKF